MRRTEGKKPEGKTQCGRGSVGRASPCQGEGREFESRRPLGDSSTRWSGREARQRTANPCTRVQIPSPPRAVGAVVARFLDTEEVASSNLASPTDHPASQWLPGIFFLDHRMNPIWLILAAIASVQCGAAVAKGIFVQAHPVTLAALRNVIAAVILLTIFRPNLRGKSFTDWALVTGYGLCLAGMNVLIYLSFTRIPIGAAVTLEFVGPLLLAVIGSRKAIDLLWVALAAAGVALLGSGPLGLDLLGALLALAAGVLWACYIAFAGPVGKAWPKVSGVAVGSLVGAVFLIVPGVIFAGTSLVNPQVWLVMAAVALLSSVLPYSLELHARRTIAAATFSILMSLEPAVAAILAWIILGEQLSWVQWLAMVCVGAASAGVVLLGKPRQT